jgi:hypothetical protein
MGVSPAGGVAVQISTSGDAELDHITRRANGRVFLLQVAWIHIDRQMILTIHRHVIARVPRFSVSHDNQKTWLLHVSGVHQEDRGYYMCQVNTNPMISQVGYLQVVGGSTALSVHDTNNYMSFSIMQ